MYVYYKARQGGGGGGDQLTPGGFRPRGPFLYGALDSRYFSDMSRKHSSTISLCVSAWYLQAPTFKQPLAQLRARAPNSAGSEAGAAEQSNHRVRVHV